jgi:hypothetical protein
LPRLPRIILYSLNPLLRKYKKKLLKKIFKNKKTNKENGVKEINKNFVSLFKDFK